jgi:hypothetical protein
MLLAWLVPRPDDVAGSTRIEHGLSQRSSAGRVHVVFFTGLISGWRAPLTTQLQDTIDSGLALEAASFDVVLSCGLNGRVNGSVILEQARAVVLGMIPTARVSLHTQNLYEYHGIRRVWEVAQSVPAEQRNDHVVLYFHCKGMFFSRRREWTRGRSPENEWLTAWIVNPWRFVVKRFAEETAMGTVGLCGDREGAAAGVH